MSKNLTTALSSSYAKVSIVYDKSHRVDGPINFIINAIQHSANQENSDAKFGQLFALCMNKRVQDFSIKLNNNIVTSSISNPPNHVQFY